MKLLSSLFIFLTLLAAHAKANVSCVSLLYKVNSSAPKLGTSIHVTDIDLVDRSYLVKPGITNPLFPSQNKTLETPQTIIDPQFNAPLVLIQKTGQTWASMYTPLKPNYAGDPRWNSAILGSTGSYYFGFRKLSDSSITAPSADYANAKIDLINLKLDEKFQIHIKFRETGEDPLSSRSYLNDFLIHNRLPLAQKGHYFIHDISYHFSSILLPENIIKNTKKRIRLILDLDLKAQELLKKKEISSLVRKAVRDELKRRVVLLDNSSGFFGWIMAQLSVVNREWPISDYYNYVQDSFFKNNQSALAETVARLQARVNSPNDKQQLLELAESLSKPEDHELDSLTYEQFMSEVLNRRNKIIEVFATHHHDSSN